MGNSDLDAQLDRVEHSVDALRRDLLHVECDRFDVDRLRRGRLLMTKLRGMLDSVDADLARRGRDLRKGGNGRGTDEALNPGGQQPDSKPPRDEQRAELHERLPGMRAATQSGEIPAEYTDAVTRAVKPLTDEERSEFFRRHQNLHTTAATLPLAAFARHVRELADQVAADCGIERLKRQRRQRSAKLWDDFDTGMTKLFAKFDPETAARVKAAVQAEIDRLYRQRRDTPGDRRSREQLMADAIANLICGGQADRRQGTDLVVLIDLHTLITDRHTAGTDSGDANERARGATDDTATASTTNDVGDADHNDSDNTNQRHGPVAAGAVGTHDQSSGRGSAPQSTVAHRDDADSDLDGGRDAAEADRGEPAPRQRPIDTDSAVHLHENVGAKGHRPPAQGSRRRPPSRTQPSPRRSRRPDPRSNIDRPPPETENERSISAPFELAHVPGRRVCQTGDGTLLPVEVVRRMACEANIIPIVLSGQGVVLDQGRRTRLATREQRISLRAMYDTCALSDCDVPFDRCEIHHLTPFAPPTNGHTNLDQLAPLCTRHHHQAHDDHWTMHLDPTNRTLTIAHPDGTTETHPLQPPGTTNRTDPLQPTGTTNRTHHADTRAA